MTPLTIVGITLPLLIGLTIYLLPPLAPYLALGITLLSLGYSVQILGHQEVVEPQLLDNFGISLQIDSLSGYFILTNALVMLSVLIYCWSQNKSAFFLYPIHHFTRKSQCRIYFGGFPESLRQPRSN